MFTVNAFEKIIDTMLSNFQIADVWKEESGKAMQKLELLKKLATDGIDPGSFNILMNIMKKITL